MSNNKGEITQNFIHETCQIYFKKGEDILTHSSVTWAGCIGIKSHGGILRVCMRIFTTAPRNKTIPQILDEYNSPYFHSVSLVIWPLTLMKSTHFSELSISKFSTYIRKAQASRIGRSEMECSALCSTYNDRCSMFSLVIVQDDHLTARAWAACGSVILRTESQFQKILPQESGILFSRKRILSGRQRGRRFF